MNDFTASLLIGLVFVVVIGTVIIVAKVIFSIWPLRPTAQRRKLLRLRTRHDTDPVTDGEPALHIAAQTPKPMLRLKRRNPESPNKAPEPTSGTVTPPAEPGVAPVPPVAHL